MKISLKSLFVAISLVLVLTLGAVFSLPDDKLHLIFCDVGQGDAILIFKGSNQVLIDGGPNQKVLSCLANHLPFWDRTIEMVVVTHPDNDHLGGLPDVIERYNVTQLVSHSLVRDAAIFWAFRDEVIEKKIPVYSPRAGDKIQLGGINLEILFPLEKLGDELVWQPEAETKVLGAYSYPTNANDVSIVSLFSYGDFDVLLPGDIGSQFEKVIEVDKEIEILKVAHHGSKYSSSEEFLGRVDPDLAVISVGNNSFGHPTSEVLERLQNLDIKLLRTDINGEIEVVSDGKTWGVKN
jgi:competence protein ComEC